MPTTFKSPAHTANVMMLADTFKQVLALIGKPLSSRGVITVEQIPAAIAALEAAGAAAAAEASPAETIDPAAEDEKDAPPALRHRFAPLIELLQISRAAGHDVTWRI